MPDITPSQWYTAVDSVNIGLSQISEQTPQVPYEPKRFGELLLKVPVLHIAKEALQFRYSTYQQLD